LKETRENLSAVAKAGLGLPIDGKGLKVRGEKHERGSSPVMMTVVSISDKFYTLVTFTRSPVIASGEKLIIKKRAHPSKLSIDYSGIDDLYAKMKHRAIWKGEV
jgi:hypothetical protein